MVVMFLCIYCTKSIHNKELFLARKCLTFRTCAVDSFRHQYFWTGSDFCSLFSMYRTLIWNNYVDIEQQVVQVIFIIFLSTWGYNSLGDTTRQYEVWKKTLLQADPIKRLTACVLAANTKFDAKMKQNYMANIIMKYQEQFVKLSR